MESTSGGSKWDSFKEAMTSTASEVIPVKEKKSRNMKKRQKIKPRNSREYKDLDKDIKKRCLEAKESWWNRQCQEMEPTPAYKKIKDLTGSKTCSSSGCIKSKEGTILVEKNQVLERWTEYIGELFQDNRVKQPAISKL